MNLWVIAFPCLIYLGSFGVQLSFHKSTAAFWANIVGAAMGIVFVYQQNTQLTSSYWSALPYFSFSLSLNVLLTLMIVIRIILHAKDTRAAMGGSGIGGLCKAIVTMFIESCALYAMSSSPAIALWGKPAVIISLSILSKTQVRAFS